MQDRVLPNACDTFAIDAQVMDPLIGNAFHLRMLGSERFTQDMKMFRCFTPDRQIVSIPGNQLVLRLNGTLHPFDEILDLLVGQPMNL